MKSVGPVQVQTLPEVSLTGATINSNEIYLGKGKKFKFIIKYVFKQSQKTSNLILVSNEWSDNVSAISHGPEKLILGFLREKHLA